MKWILNLSTRAKLFVSFGLVIVLLAAAVAVAYTSIAAIQRSQKTLFQQDFAVAVSLKDIRANQNAIRENLLAMMLQTDRASIDAEQREIEARSKDVEDTLARLLAAETLPSSLRFKLDEFNNLRTAYAKTRISQVVPLIYQRKIEEAKKLVFGVQEERNEKMRSLAGALASEAEKRAEAAIIESERLAARSGRVFGVVGAAAILLAAIMATFLNRIIAEPLKEVAGAAQRVAAGDLTVNISADNRGDEIGYLSQTFRRMVESLRELNREIRDGVNVLGSSASEIVAATTQVASGAAETATAISETTTTVEEVKQTAQLSNQKAKHVSDSAQKSAQISQSGRKSVEETVEGIGRVRQQMESIAQSVVKLSEQSQAIGEIIATVNDLADQSNLLAVNAAIEAAKAGEQGKGFAVVAQEIRSLAEQSKQATAQVRSILGDIQKATSAAVMATEQGSKAVEAGVKQSSIAGESIRTLAEAISEAAQAATQIAASSQQQLVGMDQVALAMENIKQASAQNVASTKQAETAARNLNELGQKLKQLVEQYRV